MDILGDEGDNHIYKRRKPEEISEFQDRLPKPRPLFLKTHILDTIPNLRGSKGFQGSDP